MINKILIIGGSIFNDQYFNQRVFNKAEDDENCFRDVLSDVAGVPVTSYAINGAGNDWPVNALVSVMDEIDENTYVIMQWSAVDRFDMHVDNNATNKDLFLPRPELLPKHVRYETSLYRTYGLDGSVVENGLRFYASGPAYIGRKREYKKLFYSDALHLKHAYENIALCQFLIKSKGAMQKHLLPYDINHYSDDYVTKCFAEKYNEKKYVLAPLPEKCFDILQDYPELVPWYNIVDWSLFTEHYINFFIDRGIAYWGGHNEHNLHQLPINNYKFIIDQLWKTDKDLTEKYLKATEEHCKKFDIY